MKILFYNCFHNGDLFVSKGFVQQIVEEAGQENCLYAHVNSPIVLIDTIAKVKGLVDCAWEREKFIEANDFLMINTWVGAYEREFFFGKINFPVLYKIWGIIFNKINEYFGSRLELKPSPKDYIPTIDYSKYRCAPAYPFLGKDNILICNNEVCSSQSDLMGNMEELINEVSNIFPSLNFFCTNKTNVNKKNVLYTDDIFEHTNSEVVDLSFFWQRPMRCDLNEISFLGQNCSTIVGRNSGPFIFCLTKDLFNDGSKTVISFGNQEEDSLLYNISYNCRHIFSKTTSEKEALSILKTSLKSQGY